MLTIDTTRYRSVAGFNKRQRFLVMHYTAANFASSIRALTGNAVSAHYLVPALQDPSYRAAGFAQMQVFQLVDEQDRAWHTGASHWRGRSQLNDTSIGIEIVNQAAVDKGVFSFPDFEEAQIEALIELGQGILQRYPDITPTQVLGHADIAFSRKSDPGPKFPWHRLYQAGIGAWYDEADKASFEAGFTRQLPELGGLLVAFSQYGYAKVGVTDSAAIRQMVRAFQMHFRPSRIDGQVDAETCAILYALNKKYG